jgi:transposase
MIQKHKGWRGKIVISLTASEIAVLEKVVKSGQHNARTITRAHILLLSHRGKTNREIMEMLGCSHFTVTDVRKRYHKRHCLEAVLQDAPRSGQPKKITAQHETFVVATACTDAPEGHAHWTLAVLKAKLLATYPQLSSVSHERIRHILLASQLKPWRKKNVVHTASYAAVPRADR